MARPAHPRRRGDAHRPDRRCREEVFYRCWLQTRLEALWGRGAGVLAASLAFALMHLGSHGADLDPVLRVSSVVAAQGTMGLVAGYLWSRYRRLWPPILLHVLVNGLLVAVHLVGLM